MIPKNREPTAPGTHLRRIIDETPELTQQKLAERMGVSVQTVNLIVNGKREITAETAWLLAKVFDMSPEFWMNAQATLNLWRSRRELEQAGRL